MDYLFGKWFSTHFSIPLDSTWEYSDEEKAIRIAKKEYGVDDSTVSYAIDQELSDNVYVVVVRNTSTTAAIIYYEVNVLTGEISEY